MRPALNITSLPGQWVRGGDETDDGRCTSTRTCLKQAYLTVLQRLCMHDAGLPSRIPTVTRRNILYRGTRQTVLKRCPVSVQSRHV